MTIDSFARNDAVQLHYLDSDSEAARSGVPLVIVPGALGEAGDYTTVQDALGGRRVIAMSLRGRGQSDAPTTDYTFFDHVSDIAAVVDHINPPKFCLLGYSVSVPLVISYAATHADRLAGLILVDYPARIPEYTTEWGARVLAATPDRAVPHVIDALIEDSVEIEVWKDLESIKVPTLILRGGQTGSMLSIEDARRYLEHMPEALVAVFEESGHNLSEPDPSRYFATLDIFLTQLDQMT